MLRHGIKQGITLKINKSVHACVATRHLSENAISDHFASRSISSSTNSNTTTNSGLSRPSDNAEHSDTNHRRNHRSYDLNRPRPSASLFGAKIFRLQRGTFQDRRRERDIETGRGHSKQRGGSYRHRVRGGKQDAHSEQQKPSIRAMQGELGGYLYDNFKPWTAPPKPTTTRPAPQLNSAFDIVEAIRIAFPHVQKPTSIQAQLMPAIVQGQDVLLRDETGSGK